MVSSIQTTTVGQQTLPDIRTDKVQKSDIESAKAQQNAAIVKASMEVSITAKNNTMQLLLTSVIANLNEALKPDLGDNAIQNAVNQDNTPEGTASRIVDLTTGLFSAFQEQHPEMDQTGVLDHFLETVKKGIDQGFKEARDILKGLDVLKGDIASNIDKTYELVMQKLDDFRARMQPSGDGSSSTGDTRQVATAQ
ncbi:MAG: DUF5610 domain-containing protein [Zoogloea sp.]|nr:DUF5610 domain-containing protein [Zoogloea sp.]